MFMVVLSVWLSKKKTTYQKCVVDNISLLVLLAYEGTWSVLEILLDCEFGKRDRSPRRKALPKLQVYIVR
jgi:hypothetical protein